MKLRWMMPLLGVFLTVEPLCAQEILVLKTQKEKISYLMGLDIGKSLKAQPFEIDLDALARGIRDLLQGNRPLLTDPEINEVLSLIQQDSIIRRQTRFEKDKKEAETFLSGDKGEKGITTLPSGLKYKVIQKGGGGRPRSTDKVAVHYRILRLDGAELDNTYRRGQPETLQINEVIPGLMEALGLMEEGAKWEVYVPPALSGGQFGAEVTVLFELELLAIRKK